MTLNCLRKVKTYRGYIGLGKELKQRVDTLIWCRKLLEKSNLEGQKREGGREIWQWVGSDFGMKIENLRNRSASNNPGSNTLKQD
jgi:hypothetical protein